MFKTYSEARATIAQFRRKFPQGKYLQQDEYTSMLHYARVARKNEREALRIEAAHRMWLNGITAGDRVSWACEGMFLTVVTLTGRVVMRGGIPYVRLDEPHNGKRHMRWHAGFRKEA